MSYNEQETRFYLIDPVLREKGYNDHQWLKLETPAPVEPTGPKGRRRKGSGRTDYLLCVQVGDMPKPLPVGVLEVKKEGEDPLKGMQQAKGYADCRRFDVKYVFSTNGHRYGEFDFITSLQGGPYPFADFPPHQDLTARYARDTGIDVTKEAAAMLFQADSPAWSQSRYYQDAAIRAAFEKIIRCRQQAQPARVLLALATGSGKTIIATNLLWRLSQAGQLAKPALFLCDRDELRTQAYNKLFAAFGNNVRVVETKQGDNAARNARIHIATYQTLGLDDEEECFASFLTEYYGEDAFSIIIIDECHRSAWGKWSEVLKRNPNAVHIGLTATPRQLQESKNATAEDRAITANNHTYFGRPVYEYTLIQAQEDGYLAACEIVKRKASIDNRIFTKAEILAARPVDIRTGRPLTEADLTKSEYTGKDFDDELFIEPPAVAAVDGYWVTVTPQGRFILSNRDGRDTPIPVDEYRREVIQRVFSEAHNLDEFRALWIETQKRRQLINHLLGDNFSPEVIREIDQMNDFDLYDFFGHHGYHARALKRPERGELYIAGNQGWFGGMDGKAAIVLKGLGSQFAQGGTEALETPALWEVPEIKMVGGLDALRVLGQPAAVIHEAKERLFGV